MDALKIVKGLLTDDSVKTACENICPQLWTLFPESDEEVEDANTNLLIRNEVFNIDTAIYINKPIHADLLPMALILHLAELAEETSTVACL